jgi:predicted Zn-dependent protease
MRIARVLIACLGVLACAWFVLGIHQAHDTDRVTAIVGGLTGQQRLTAQQAAHANALLDSATTLNPDRTIDLLRARVALLRGDRPTAKRILLGVVTAEPDNIDAWYGLATSASDGATVQHALARIAQLNKFPPK